MDEVTDSRNGTRELVGHATATTSSRPVTQQLISPPPDTLTVTHGRGPSPQPSTWEAEPPFHGGGSSRGRTGSEAPGNNDPRGRSRLSGFLRSSIFALGIAAVVLVTTVGITHFAKTGRTPLEQFTYSFPEESYPALGVTLTRVWTITGGNEPTLEGDLFFHANGKKAVTIEEVLPSSFGDARVSFKPEPMIESAHIVRYALPAQAGLVTDSYSVPVQGSDVSMATLKQWAAQQRVESSARYRRTHPTEQLASLSLSPRKVTVTAGRTTQLVVQGKDSNGTAAASLELAGARFSVANPKIAEVSPTGLVTGLSPGKTTIRISSGRISAASEVTVLRPVVRKIPALPPGLTLFNPLESLLSNAALNPQPDGNSDSQSPSSGSGSSGKSSGEAAGKSSGKTSGSGSTTTPKPTHGKVPPKGPVTVPTVPVTVPTVPVTIPTVPVTVPTVPVTVPTVPVTVPTVPVTVPTDPVVTPTDPVVTPTDPVVTPTDPVAPTDPVVTPTDPVVTPTDPTTP